MTSDDTQKEKPARGPLWLGILLLLWVLFGSLPLLSQKFGYQYFPSSDWLILSRHPATIVGVISAIGGTWLAIKGYRASERQMGRFARAFVFTVGFFMFFVIASHSITMGFPMVGAILAGHKVEFPFTVSEIKQKDYGECRNPITLDGLSYLMDRLCDTKIGFGQSLEIGEQVLIWGRGTQLGVFDRDVRRVGR